MPARCNGSKHKKNPHKLEKTKNISVRNQRCYPTFCCMRLKIHKVHNFCNQNLLFLIFLIPLARTVLGRRLDNRMRLESGDENVGGREGSALG
jgi:hypothetical protein